MGPAPQRDNEFWTFSLALYAAPDVAAECLSLQDRYGVDVNLLLFFTWLGASRRKSLSASEVEQVRGRVAHWHATVVRPLRAVRRDLKEARADSSQALRDRVKALELEAEQIEQAMLFEFASETWPAPGDDDPRDAACRNLRLYLVTNGCADPAVTTCHLVDAAMRTIAATRLACTTSLHEEN